MDPEEELLQIHPLNEPNSIQYKLLLASLESRHYAAFKSFINKALKKHPSGVNIDHVFPHPHGKTFLDIASSDGLEEFIELLLDLGADPNKINEAHNRAPIHFAVENGHVNVLKILLEDPAINPNLEVGRQTALHLAVKNRDNKCIETLLSAGARPDIPNAKGITAFHQAASSKLKDIVHLILNKEYTIPLDLDSFKDYKNQTTRDILKQNFSEILLPEQQTRRTDFDLLRYFLEANDEKNFLEKLAEIDSTENINVHELIKIAARHNLPEAFVKLISREEIGDISEAAVTAVQRGHHEILKEILKYDPDLSKKLIIPACQELTIPSRRGSDHRNVRLQCLKLILAQKNVSVRVEDEKGNTPLHYAARAENSRAVELLLEAGSYIGHMNHFGVPPLAHICPETLTDYFDKCLQSSNDRTDEYEIQFNYHCLMPHTPKHETEEPLLQSAKSNRTKRATEMQALNYIAHDKALKHLLKHPLLSSFLFIKWSRIRYFLHINLAFYLMFYVLLNSYIIFANTKSEENKGVYAAQEGIFWVVTITAIVLLAVRESLQCLSSPGHYVTSFENWLEVALVVLAAVFLFTNHTAVGAVVILLSAWELVLLIGQHPKMSTGIEIFKTVSTNFIKFLFLYAFLILSFALAFYTLFKEDTEGDGNKPFPNAPQSIFKTIVMLTGEFEASDIPFVLHPVVGHIIFILFEFLIAIVLFNLLTGLAVSDTQEILAEAELVSLISRTKLVSYAEGVAVGLPFFPKNKCLCCLLPVLQTPKVNPLAFLAKRILIFPKYLPEGKLSVKPYKNHEIVLQGRQHFKFRKFATLKLDAAITINAKEILSQRGRVTNEERVVSEIEAVNRRLDAFEIILINLQEFFSRNNNNVSNNFNNVIDDDR